MVVRSPDREQLWFEIVEDDLHADLTLGAKVRITLSSIVRWEHNVRVPSIHIEADGSRSSQGYPVRRRRSKIHRTHLPGRCHMVARRTAVNGFAPIPGYSPTMLRP